jgi:hypothetical protein
MSIETSDPALKGIGGAPTRATTLPTSAAERKKYPISSGVLDYFPDALVAISNLSQKGNDQHNPGNPLHWDRSKSGDEADTMMRHFLQRGTLDTDGVRHSTKMAWRALALLQKEIESEQKSEPTYPRYWFNEVAEMVYRAKSATCRGQMWERDRRVWIDCAPGATLADHVITWAQNYKEITKEKAAELVANTIDI